MRTSPCSVAGDLASPEFRTYVSTDIMGVEIGGAMKNVIAIGAGLSDGLGFGANMRVALITRGLNEMMRVGVALGAREKTFMGLAGLGDLVLTCTDDQSRNRRYGLALARGLTPDQAMREIGQVVEGYHAARVLRAVAQRLEAGPAHLRGHLPRAVRWRRCRRRGARAHAPSAGSGVQLALLVEPALPPGFVDHHGHRIGQVQAAIAWPHRDAHAARSAAARAGQLLRHAAGLAARTGSCRPAGRRGS